MKLTHFLALSALSTVAAAAAAADQPVIGLITKTEINPFFVKMRKARNRRPRPAAPSC